MNGRVNRRALFTSGAAAALLSAAGMSAQAAPKRGGNLRIAASNIDMARHLRLGAVFETLTEIGADGVLRPMLAENWQSDDGRIWDITLKSGVYFHDGTVLDAGAVVRALGDVFHDIDAVSDQHVRIALDASDMQLPLFLADPNLSIIGENGINGTGPFEIVSEPRQGQFIAKRVARHHRDGHAGWADRIEVITISDAAIRSEALRDGHVDVAALPDPMHLNGTFHYHPTKAEAAIVSTPNVLKPERISRVAEMDGWRIAERWWLA